MLAHLLCYITLAMAVVTVRLLYSHYCWYCWRCGHSQEQK
jgi:hypothetical protein